MPKPACSDCAHLVDDCCACRDCLQYRYWRPGVTECEWYSPAPVLDLNPADKAMLETRRMAEAELWRAFRLPTLGIGLVDEATVENRG
jgi:hypothetical protein